MEPLNVPIDSSLQNLFISKIDEHVALYSKYLNHVGRCQSVLETLKTEDYLPRSLRLGVHLQVNNDVRRSNFSEIAAIEASMDTLVSAFQKEMKLNFIIAKEIELNNAQGKLSNAWRSFMDDLLLFLQPVFNIYAKKAGSQSVPTQFSSFERFQTYVFESCHPGIQMPPPSPSVSIPFPFITPLIKWLQKYDADILALELTRDISALKVQINVQKKQATAAVAMEVECDTPTMDSVNQIVDRKLQAVHQKLKILSNREAAPVSRKSGKPATQQRKGEKGKRKDVDSKKSKPNASNAAKNKGKAVPSNKRRKQKQ